MIHREKIATHVVIKVVSIVAVVLVVVVVVIIVQVLFMCVRKERKTSCTTFYHHHHQGLRINNLEIGVYVLQWIFLFNFIVNTIIMERWIRG